MKAIYIIAIVLALAGCDALTQPDKARRVLENAGYTAIEMQGYDWLACGKDDTFHDKFTATAPNGARVSGVVCAGLFFKGSTIRFD